LASLEERSTYGELDCFLKVEDKKLDALEGDNLVDKVAEIYLSCFRSLQYY